MFSIGRYKRRHVAFFSIGILLVAIITVASFSVTHVIGSNTQELAASRISAVNQQFEDVPALTQADALALRTFRNAEHVARAESLGVADIADRDTLPELVAEDELVPLETNAYFGVDKMDFSSPFVTPAAANLLELVGRRFQERLADEGLPPYRYVITSATRTRQDQRKLQGVNINAATKSSHEFGTTVDVHYREFEYVPQLDTVPESFWINEFQLREQLEQAFNPIDEERQRALKGILGRTLRELQAEGDVLVIYERRQPVYHITVAKDIQALDTTGTEASAVTDAEMASASVP